MNSIRIQPACTDQLQEILTLLPRLAHFEVPSHREATELWSGDAQLIESWAAGQRHDVTIYVAIDELETILGVAVASEREDFLNHSPSAHLEVLAVAEHAEGQGLGKLLLDNIEQTMRDKGLNGMSLHVFSNNKRALALYQRMGFQPEIFRCFKPFDQ